MLQPANRLTLIDSLRPPAGFRISDAMAVTFTLDLRALLAASAAFSLSGPVGADGEEDRLEPIELLHALRTQAGKITVFHQAGFISLPPSRRVFAFLEDAVVSTHAPGGGIVHPKVWVLRYEAVESSRTGGVAGQRLRVLVASRNLTFDSSWDTVLRFDEALGSGGPGGEGSTGEAAVAGGVGLAAVGELFEGLAGAAVGDVSDAHQRRVRSLGAALRAATFALPKGVDDARVHVLGLDASLPDRRPSPFPSDADRSLVISPFVSDRFFGKVYPHRVDELVSREESLDSMRVGTLERFGAVHVFDDGSVIEHDDDHDGEADSAKDSDRRSDSGAARGAATPEDPGQPLAGLHAKVFAFEHGDQARLFVGSANATGPAFSSSVEILVELIGSTDALGIDRLCGNDPAARSLRDHFLPYHRSSTCPIPPPASPLDTERVEIARTAITGTVEPSGDDWAVTYRAAEPLPVSDRIEIHCWPLASPGQRRRVSHGQPFEERFETSLESISGFLAFELTTRARSGGQDASGDTDAGGHSSASGDTSNARQAAAERTEFVVPVPLDGVPDHRGRFLLRALVGNAERFLRYLLALLSEDTDPLELLEAAERASAEGDSDGTGVTSLPVLEQLLRTMRRDPAKLAGLHPLVSDLADDGALPEGFAELWDAIFDAAIAGAAPSADTETLQGVSAR